MEFKVYRGRSLVLRIAFLELNKYQNVPKIFANSQSLKIS